uniref:DUF4062 domain-containing protein n=1 Tax=Timema douglasi TaxID=61478 RepID=A0A7R8Z5Z8_TIMDO|nr:unnamed protein product [Timema douglasi]
MTSEDKIKEFLQGQSRARKLPLPKITKIFVASTRTDFVEERRHLLEMVGPELQSHYDDMGLEIELVDMHYGTTVDPCYDAELFVDHLHELGECHRVSMGCFFICLVGDKYQPYVLPLTLEKDSFQSISTKANCNGLNSELLDTWYTSNDQENYVLQQPRDITCEEWLVTQKELSSIIQSSAQELATNEIDSPTALIYHALAWSALERQFNHALGLTPGTAHHILAVVRDWEGLEEKHADYQDLDNEGHIDTKQKEQLKTFRNRLATSLPNDNRIYFSRRIVADLLSDATSQLDMTSPELLPFQQYWDVYVLDGPRSPPIFLPSLHGH